MIASCMEVIQSDITRIVAASKVSKKALPPGARNSVSRYVGVLLEVQDSMRKQRKLDEDEARKLAGEMPTEKLLEQLMELPGVRDYLGAKR